jgi:hypothetical protein
MDNEGRLSPLYFTSPHWETPGACNGGKAQVCIEGRQPIGVSEPAPEYLKPALAPIATALTEELAALLAAALDGRKKKTLDRLSQALSDAVPELLQRAFEHELLADSVVALERRATLVAALSAVTRPSAERPLGKCR